MRRNWQDQLRHWLYRWSRRKLKWLKFLAWMTAMKVISLNGEREYRRFSVEAVRWRGLLKVREVEFQDIWWIFTKQCPTGSWNCISTLTAGFFPLSCSLSAEIRVIGNYGSGWGPRVAKEPQIHWKLFECFCNNIYCCKDKGMTCSNIFQFSL